MTDDVEQNEWCPNCGNADTWNGDECSICQPLFDSYDQIESKNLTTGTRLAQYKKHDEIERFKKIVKTQTELES